MRSPIEIMIDNACGFTPTSTESKKRLRCPDCDRVSNHASTIRDGDIVKGYFIELRCPECWEKSDG